MEQVSESEWKDLAETPSDAPEEESWFSAEENATPADEQELTESFDPRWMEPFEGLLYLGFLDGTVSIAAHSFAVRTLTVGEKLEAMRITRDFEGQMNYLLAYRAAVVAAGFITCDSRPIPVTSRKISAVRQKWEYILDNWHESVIDLLYLKIHELEQTVIKILDHLGVYDEVRRITPAPEEADEGTNPPDES